MEKFDKLVTIIEKLRSPEGCPWDREQNHKSLKPFVIEEAYEVVEAIDNENDNELLDELGDLLLQVVLHSQIASEENRFTIEDVLTNLSDKMVRRHPHVFDSVEVDGSSQVLKNWEDIKRKEKAERTSALDGITSGMPALYRAHKMQKRAAITGFDWPDTEGPLHKLHEEIDELEEAVHKNDIEHVKEEFGDVLFSMVNLARKLKFDAEDALRGANRKFDKRFRYIESKVAESDRAITEHSLEELEDFWTEAKSK